MMKKIARTRKEVAGFEENPTGTETVRNEPQLAERVPPRTRRRVIHLLDSSLGGSIR